ncbi:GDP-mannose 4,6-dehydratase [Glaciihabitans sp. dw_435]|uniref:GDP-mannose 4,6-dehydratase n=1 Tax=Glaciihabitans sp. dw_435 TaxID=2720081 RepID=UPI001BD43E65|nr:GDP-mannose 4,6-dehydratase [Glaciihabitans sp. dw_435]
MKTALITGITGQTGGYLCEQLVDAGWEVHGLVRDADDLESDFRGRFPGVTLHSGDLTSEASLRNAVMGVRPGAIFNLGGLSSVSSSWKAPVLTGQVNGMAVGMLLELAAELRRETGERLSFVQASSAEIFGVASQVPQNEDTPVRPVNPYGASKAYAHHLVGVYRRAGLSASSCILYNHESPRRPESFVTRKITRGVARISAGLDSTLTLGSLDVKRDWGWAPDYARALALAAEAEAGDYVIATGTAHTVRDFVSAAFGAVGITDWEPFVEQDPAFMRAQDAPNQVGDASRAREVLGWEPSVEFDELVRRMVDHDLELVRAASSN